MKAFAMKVDTGPRRTLCFGDERRAAGTANLSDHTSHTAEHVVVTTFPWVEGTPRTINHEGRNAEK